MFTLTPETATSHNVCSGLMNLVNDHDKTIIFEQANKPKIVIFVDVLSMSKKIKLWTKEYGELFIDFTEKRVYNYLTDLELNRVLLMGIKLFAMSYWRISFDHLHFISANVKNSIEVLTHVHNGTLARIKSEPQRYMIANEYIEIAFDSDFYHIRYTSYSHYDFHSIGPIAKIRYDGLEASYATTNEKLIPFIMAFIGAIVG